MKCSTVLMLLLFILLPLVSCSRNQVGDLFRDFEEGDAGDDGFDPGGPGGDGSFLLYSLESGSLFVNGAPVLLAGYPEDGATGAWVDTLVVLRFSESLNPDATVLEKGVTIEKASNGSMVGGTFSVAPGSAGTVLVFESNDSLEAESLYQVSITADLQDAQGTSYDPGEGAQATVFSFTTGGAGQGIPFGVIDSLTFPGNGAEKVSDGTSILLFFTEAVDASAGGDGLGGDSDNLGVEGTISGTISGARSFHFGDRLLVFKPSNALPGGEEVTVTVKENVKNGDGTETLGETYNTSFEVVSFPRVTALSFSETDPLIVLPASIFQGKINLSNQNAFKVDVTLEGEGSAAKLTLLFWDNHTHAVIVVLEGLVVAGTQSLTVNLKPGVGDAILDGTVTVGAYTTGEGVNSPVGPPQKLPDLLKDVVTPSLLSLGPPQRPPDLPSLPSYHLLTETPDPGIHGLASEALSNVEVTAEFLGAVLPAVEAIVFFSMEYPQGSGIYSEEVTRGVENLFITGTLVDIGTGGLAPPGPRKDAGPPVTITKIVIADLVGNTKVYEQDLDASMTFRGFFYSLPAAPQVDDLEILCYDSATLEPIENVDLILEDVDDLMLSPWVVFTNGDGEAFVDSVAGPLVGDRMILTAVRDGYRVLSFVWNYTGTDLLLSLPLAPENPDDLSAGLAVTIGNGTGADLPFVYFGGTELITQGDDVLVKSQTANPLSVTLDVKRDRLQFVEGLAIDATPVDQYQWAWSNPFVQNPAGGVQAVLFKDPLSEPDPDHVQALSFDDPSVTDDFTRNARVVAAVPGITGTLPIGADLTVDSSGTRYAFDVPVPPTLFSNEVMAEPLEDAALDPPYELVIEPKLGKASNDALVPDLALLEETIRFEMERIESGAHPAVVGQRFPYDAVNFGPDPLIDVQARMPDPVIVGTTVDFENVLKPFQTGDFKIGAYRLALTSPDTTRHWSVFVNYAATEAGDTVTFDYPDLEGYGGLGGLSGTNDFTGFSATGDYPFFIEAYHVSNFEITNGMLSVMDQRWKTFWRTAQTNLTK